MQCARCGAENREGRRFCAQCGAPLAAGCSACGFVNQPDDNFCGGCGMPLAQATEPARAPARPTGQEPWAEGERRHVTVLFCDLAGYTSLTHELGAEVVHVLTDRFFVLTDGLIRRFGGSIDKHIGDCVMGVFGAPVAYGNDAERAVRAALAIRDAVPALGQEVGRRVGVHIGIASGQVVASGGAGYKTYSITGDSVNLASRLTDQAESGIILISDAVRRMLADRIDCAGLGGLDVKGLGRAVQVFRLIGLHEPEAPTDRPFVGRRAELQQFAGVLKGCIESGVGQAIYLRGEAGIGKSRLIEECQKLASALGFASHTSLVLDFGTATGHDAVRELARGLLGLGRVAPHAEASAVADRALQQGPLGPDYQVYLNDLLDLPQPVELRALYDAMDNTARNRGKQDTLAKLVVQTSRHKPRLLIVEDVHWAEPLTLEHLASLTLTVTTCPAVLVMTSRLESDPLDHAWRSRIAGSPLLTIDLGPLRRDEANALARTYFEASSELAKRCVKRAAGNPLFLDQLLRHAEEIAELGVPDSVQSLVQARLDHLTPADRQALQAASVLGQRFALDAIGYLIERDDYLPAELVRHFLIRPQGGDFLFAHALIRDAVYELMHKARRRNLHRRAATWFEGQDQTLRAEHLDRAEDPQAPLAYLAAARAQTAAYHYERALSLVERGLVLAHGSVERFELLCLRGEILHDLGAMTRYIPVSICNVTDAGTAYEEALEAATHDRERCRAWLGLAAVKRVTEDLDGAFADLERAEAAATALGLSAELARIHFLRGNLHYPRGQIEACLMEHQKSLEFAQRAGSTELGAAALGGMGDAEYVRGHMITARRYFERSIELCRRHGFGRIEVASLPMAAFTRFYAGELPGAYADALAAVAAAERVRHHRAAIITCHIVFFAAMSQAEPDVASRHVERAIDLSRQLGAQRFEAEGLWFQAEILQAEGRQTDALTSIRQALEISRETGMAYLGPAILGGLAHITDDPEERRAALAEAEQLLAAGSISHNFLWFYSEAIDTALEQHDWSEAKRYAQALADYTRREPLPYIDVVVARANALAALGRGQRGSDTVEALRQVREGAEAIGWRSLISDLDTALASVSPVPTA
jgi:class 3 adenylate cyclase/tetratricopeptide (TPR) repeat protein